MTRPGKGLPSKGFAMGVRLRAVLAGAGFAAWGAVACAGRADPNGAGGECFRAQDCQEGLICVEGVCTSDLSGIVSTVEGPAAGGETPEPEPDPEDAGTEPMDAGTSTSGVGGGPSGSTGGTGAADAGTMDANIEPSGGAGGA